MGHWGTGMVHLYYSGSAVRIVLQFCTVKGTKRDMEIILLFFLQKDLIHGIFVIFAQKWYVIITFWICPWFFFLVLHNMLLVVLFEKNLIWRNLIILGHFLLFDWMCSKLIQATVTNGSLNSHDMISFMVTTGFWNSQDIIRIHD